MLVTNESETTLWVGNPGQWTPVEGNAALDVDFPHGSKQYATLFRPEEGEGFRFVDAKYCDGSEWTLNTNMLQSTIHEQACRMLMTTIAVGVAFGTVCLVLFHAAETAAACRKQRKWGWFGFIMATIACTISLNRFAAPVVVVLVVLTTFAKALAV